jgi:glutaredoxin
MPVTCPKCGHVRPPDAAVPDYECPACGVIYAKAKQAPAAREARPILYGDRPAKSDSGWAKWLLVAAVVAYGAVLGHRSYERHHEAREAVADGDLDPDADAIPTDVLRAFAARVQARDVVMYSTTECVYCGQAKGWLSENGFAFTDCNMSLERHCVDEFQGYRANGTPFLVVRGRLMRDGFDVRQFLQILKDTD